MSSRRRPASLFYAFTLPMMGGVLLLSGAIGAISYRSAYDAAQTQAARGLQAQVQRVGEAWARRTVQAEAVLTVAFPKGLAVPVTLKPGPNLLRQRF